MPTDNVIREKIEAMLPSHMQQSVEDYIFQGRPVGDFLTGIITGDLYKTYHHADGINTKAVRDYVSFFFNYAPGGCWGSPTQKKIWQNQGGLNRIMRSASEKARSSG